MVSVRIVESKTVWEQFLLSQEWQPFFQSWNWGEVQKRIGNSIFRYGLYDRSKLVGICLAVLVQAKRGRYLHLRHGPLLTDFAEQFDSFLMFVKQKAKERRVDFIRMSPLLEQNLLNSHSGLSRIVKDDGDSGLAVARQNDVGVQFFRKRGFRNAPIHNMDAENAWVLDLDKSEEELPSGMRKTTRYLVKKAQALPIAVMQTVAKRDFDKFMELYEVTSRRHKFVPHRGIREEFDIFTKEGQAKLFLAYYKKKVLSGALIIFYGNQAVYHHGASSDEHKDIPAAYLLQWEAIKEAKRQGKKLYNFWGVVPPEKPNHPWQGLTHFKTGFGGRRINFLHAQDLPLSVNYWKIFAIETIWRIRKGY